MSVTFANVTTVKIPQGDVTKIQETSGQKRVLWEKKTGNYPRFFMLAKVTNDTSATNFTYYNSSSKDFLTYSPPTGITASDAIPINSVMTSQGTIQTGTTVSIGNTFSACYVTNATEEKNAKTSAKTLTDATWVTSPVWMIPGTYSQIYASQGLGLSVFGTGTNATTGISTTTLPLTFSSTSGATINIKKVNTISSYITLYEEYSTISLYKDRYKSKSVAPYLYVCFGLGYKSSNLATLAGGMSSTGVQRGIFGTKLPAYSPSIIFYFTVKR